MQTYWDIPTIEYRDWQGFKVDVPMGARHVRGVEDFCRSCAADLRVTRLLVSRVSYADAGRFTVAQLASQVLDGSGLEPGDEQRWKELEFSAEEVKKLVTLFEVSVQPTSWDMCGLVDAGPVGITTNGIFLYAIDEYLLGPETCLSECA